MTAPAAPRAPLPDLRLIVRYDPGVVFDPARGLLRVYGAQHRLELRLWPAPGARIDGAPPDGQPPSLAYSLFEPESPDRPWALPPAAAAAVPPGVVAAVRAFCWPAEQLRGLLLIGDVPEVLALAEALPALARALLLRTSGAEGDAAGRGRLAAALAGQAGPALVGRALRWLGLPDSPRFIEQLGHIDHAPSWSLEALRALAAAPPPRPGARLARAPLCPLRQPVIDIAVQLGLLSALQPRFFDALAQVRAEHGDAGLCLRAMLEVIAEHRRVCGEKPGVIRSLHDLQRRADWAAEVLARLSRPPMPPLDDDPEADDPEADHPEGPPPPLDPPPFARPLRSAAALHAEGQAMLHCLSAPDFALVLAREAYFFALELDGERATLMLRFTQGGPVRVAQLRGPGNDEVSGRLAARVHHWIGHLNLWIDHAEQPSSLPPPLPDPQLRPELAEWGPEPGEDERPALMGLAGGVEGPLFPGEWWQSEPVAPRRHPPRLFHLLYTDGEAALPVLFPALLAPPAPRPADAPAFAAEATVRGWRRPGPPDPLLHALLEAHRQHPIPGWVSQPGDPRP